MGQKDEYIDKFVELMKSQSKIQDTLEFYSKLFISKSSYLYSDIVLIGIVFQRLIMIIEQYFRCSNECAIAIQSWIHN